jgi:hypothetical protein
LVTRNMEKAVLQISVLYMVKPLFSGILFRG